MRFFFPDSQDLVDPSFDFATEKRSVDRLRQRDDLFAHEVFPTPVYDGLLVSKGIVDGYGPSSARYTLAQRHRLLRGGVQEFFRLDRLTGPRLPIIGDCGAFTYVKEPVPPYSVDEVLDFYSECRFDYGISVDHVILAYQPSGQVSKDVVGRQEITLELADEFLRKHRFRKLQFEPIGVAQGWSPQSYAQAVRALQRMGYRYIALGGMVPLKSREILACLEGIQTARKPSTRFHLLGVTRIEHLEAFQSYGVVSFDSTTPLRQAFKDGKDNYHTIERNYTAIRVPQVEGNASLNRRIQAGQVRQGEAMRLERACLDTLSRFDAGKAAIEEALSILGEYEQVFSPGDDHSEPYRRVLEHRPWQKCPCAVCRSLGHHVVLFRGAERNRRRGFHNVWVFYTKLRRSLDTNEGAGTDAA